MIKMDVAQWQKCGIIIDEEQNRWGCLWKLKLKD